MEKKSRFQIPRGLSQELTLFYIENEFNALWDRLSELSKNWRQEPSSLVPGMFGPDIIAESMQSCSCDVKYLGGHMPNCRKRPGR